MPLNVEIKAKCQDPDRIRRRLEEMDAEFVGLDHQVDTYFEVPRGRLKLREGTIERSLIYYRRPDRDGPKTSEVMLYHPSDAAVLGDLLRTALQAKVVVDKQREIYFVGNVKIHLDIVDGLGSFVEIEAIDREGDVGENRLYEQCTGFMERFEIQNRDLVGESYSDMILALDTS